MAAIGPSPSWKVGGGTSAVVWSGAVVLATVVGDGGGGVKGAVAVAESGMANIGSRSAETNPMSIRDAS